MYQYEKRLDCHALGQEIKRRRKAKGWTQEHLAQLVDLTPRSIMYIENRGQHTSLNAFYKLVTLFDISVDEFFYPDKLGGESERRKHIDRMLNSMGEKELIIIEGAAENKFQKLLTLIQLENIMNKLIKKRMLLRMRFYVR